MPERRGPWLDPVALARALDASGRRRPSTGLDAAQRELLLLMRAGEALVSTLRLEDVLRELGRQLVPEVADAAEVALVDDDGRIRRIVVTTEDMLARERERMQLTVRDAHPVAEAVRTGRMRLLDMERTEDVAAFGSPDQPGTAASFGLTRAVIVPLVTRERIVGALNLGLLPVRPAWTPERLDVIAEVGRRAAAALENARLYEQQRLIATRLQQALLPDRIDAPEGLAVAARYAPGAAGMDVGGDWYDAVLRADDVVVAVGDVVGHGLDSAALMGRLRTMFWTLLAQGQPPAEAMRWVNRFLGEL